MEERFFAGRFRAVERLDRGGSVETFRAVDEAGEVYAVDILHPSDPAESARLGHTMQEMAAFSHPNIPHIYEWGTDGADFHVVREYVDGWDLTMLLRRGPLDSLRVARYGAEVAFGLAEAHAAGIIHGSLGTSAVMVTPEGQVRVLGFGETLTKVVALGESPAAMHFVAPELIQGGTPTEASDIYALGVVLHETATTSVPFEAETAGDVASLHVDADAEPARRLNPAIAAALEVIIARALRKDPEDRYRSALEMGQDLERVAAQIQDGAFADESPTRPRVSWPRVTLPRRAWITAAAGVLVLLLGVGTGGVVWWSRNMAAVPSLVGLAPNVARAKITAAGLVPGALVFTPTVTAGVPEGLISVQTLRPGGWARVGTLIGVAVNGPLKVKVPALAGATEASAIATIQASGLAIAGINPVFCSATEGTVVTQTPSAGAAVPKGSGITLSVSSGPRVGVVPSVVGEVEAAARTSLTQAGFKATSSRQSNDTVAVGTVISQTPLGATSALGATVELVVSGGPAPVTVPTATGQSLASAIIAVQSAGLKIRVSSSTVAGSVAGGTKANPAIGQVLSQAPSAGSVAKVGDTVTLTFGLP